MRYKARYIHRKKESPDYWFTIYGDNPNEAMRIAERYTKKGFLCVGVKSEDNYL